MQEFPVLVEKDGEFVAHFKSTVCILPRGTIILAGALPVDVARFEATATHKIESEEVKALVSKELWKKL
jgi:ABC-type uncharacterized transport system ATPase subunit